MNSVKTVLILFLLLFGFQATKAEWVKQESNTLAWLYDINFINEKQGWIAGSNGTLLRTNDGGQSWNKIINFTQDTIKQVHFFDINNGWLLCERNIYNRGANASSYLLKTSDGGKSWNTINFTGGGRGRIAKIFFNKSGNGWAIGEAGASFVLQSDQEIWKKRPAPMSYLMLGGVFTNDTNGAIVGAGGSIVFTEDMGSTWNPAAIAGESESKLNSIFFIDEKTGWAVGNDGKVLQTINGGKFWREQNSTVNANLTDVFFKDTAEGWAIGDAGTILHTKTAGNVWISENLKINHKLEKIFFAGGKGWIVGFGGLIMNYNVSEINKSTAKPHLILRN